MLLFLPDEAAQLVKNVRINSFSGLNHLGQSNLAKIITEHTSHHPVKDAGEQIMALETSRPWFDLGTPAGYLIGVCDWAQRRGPVKVAGRSWVAADAVIHKKASVRRGVVESRARLAADVQVERSIVLSEARIGRRCRVRDSIIGSRVELPAGTVVDRRLVTRARADVTPRERDSVVGGLVYSPLG